MKNPKSKYLPAPTNKEFSGIPLLRENPKQIQNLKSKYSKLVSLKHLKFSRTYKLKNQRDPALRDNFGIVLNLGFRI